MSKLTEKGPLSNVGVNPDVPEHCTKNGASMLGDRLVEYHAQRGRRIEVRVSPVDGKYGSPRASNRMYKVVSDIDPVRMA